jgi:hypothetical protein
LTPAIGTLGALEIVKNGIELRKLWPFNVEGVKNSNKQTTKYYKDQFPNTNKFLVCCFVVIRIQK